MYHSNIWECLFIPSDKQLRIKALERKYPEFFNTNCIGTTHSEGQYQVIIYKMIWLNHTSHKVLYIPCVLEDNQLHIKIGT